MGTSVSKSNADECISRNTPKRPFINYVTLNLSKITLSLILYLSVDILQSSKRVPKQVFFFHMIGKSAILENPFVHLSLKVYLEIKKLEGIFMQIDYRSVTILGKLNHRINMQVSDLTKKLHRSLISNRRQTKHTQEHLKFIHSQPGTIK